MILHTAEVITVYVLRVGYGTPTYARFAGAPIVGVYLDKCDAHADGLGLLAEHGDLRWYVITAGSVRRLVKTVVAEVVA